MNHVFETLKECNDNLNKLKTEQYRFVAWVIYSVKHQSFIAGVDAYTNNGENLQMVVFHSINKEPGFALLAIRAEIDNWIAAGAVPI